MSIPITQLEPAIPAASGALAGGAASTVEATSSSGQPGTESARPWQPHPLPSRSWLSALTCRSTMLLNRVLDAIPGSAAWYARSVRGTELPEIPIHLRRGSEALEGLRIAFLSDIHAGSFLDERALLPLFERVAAAKPDLVCFGGDLINSRPCEIEHLLRPLELLRPRLGAFACVGNHDLRFGGDLRRWQEVLELHGVQLLVNRGVRIPVGTESSSSLWIGGVDDLQEGRPDLGAALAGRRPDEATLLLAHQPDHFVEAAGADVDLTLSGHTHGGQVRLFGWAPLTHSRSGFCAGLFERADAKLYVTRGVGATALPLRIGASPEIPILRLTGRTTLRPDS